LPKTTYNNVLSAGCVNCVVGEEGKKTFMCQTGYFPRPPTST